MPTLHALLVAINDYPTPRHRLDGCRHDLQQLHEWLAAQYGDSYRQLTLLDAQATREAIIRGFDHFAAAQPGDTCLFFFAGHGSRLKAPQAFWHLEPSRMNQSILCYDSRTEGGRDLIDKELSYLIWKATEGRDVHFTVIMDCCHAGSNTRFEHVRARMAEAAEVEVPVEDYLGVEHYQRNTEGQYSPPRGPHVALAAALAKETAKELPVNGQSSGAFTHSLVEVLRAGGGRLSYAEIMRRVNLRVRGLVSDQSPQLETSEPAAKRLSFLSRTTAEASAGYLLSAGQDGVWRVNAGAIQGIRAGEGAAFLLADTGKSLPILAVEPARTLVDVSAAGSLQAGQSYAVRLKHNGIPRLRVAPAPGQPAEAFALFRGLLAEKTSDLIEWTDDVNQARYWLYSDGAAQWLSRPAEERPLFQRIKGQDKAAAVDLLNKLETVARWVQLLELDNPATTIREQELSVELFRTTTPGRYDEDAPVEPVEVHEPAIFAYAESDGQWHQPAFRLRLRNTGLRKLWVSLLYQGEDFSINNVLLPKQELNPNDEAWALNIYEGYPYRTIELQLADALHDGGVSEIAEFLKIIISTEEFDTDDFNQAGLPPDQPLRPTRGFGRGLSMSKPDWTAREVELRIRRPLQVQVEGGGGKAEVGR